MSATKHVNLSLDLVRGIAALLVVLSHARLYTHGALGIDLSELPTWVRVALVPTSFGKESVALFFVLSGFLVGGQVIRQVKRDTFNPATYAVNRLSRLWSVLVPGLVFTALVDYAAAGIFGEMTGLVTTHYAGGALVFLCNAAFLQEARCSTFGSNDALWSLSYEFWFYVLFAASAVTVASFLRGRRVPAFAALVVAVGAVAVFGGDLLALLPTWLVGASVALLVDRAPLWLRGKVALWITPVLAAGGMVASNVVHMPEPAEFALVGIASAPMIAAFAIQDPAPSGIFGVAFRLFAAVGAWSFSLYVFHLPLVKLASLAVPDTLNPAALVAVVYAIATAATLCVYPLYLGTESHTSKLRGLMLRLIGQGQPSPALRAGLPIR